MFPLSIDLYAKLFGGAVLLLGCFFLGWNVRNNDYMAYKKEIENVAKVQEAKIESIQKQQTLVNQGIEKEYNAKLALLRNYYANNGMHNASSGKLPDNASTPIGIDAVTAYNLLAGQCSEATQQLVSLQEWLNAQMGIK